MEISLLGTNALMTGSSMFCCSSPLSLHVIPWSPLRIREREAYMQAGHGQLTQNDWQHCQQHRMWIQCTQVPAPFQSKHIQIQTNSASSSLWHPEFSLSPHIYLSALGLFGTQLTAPGPVHRQKDKCFALQGRFTMAVSLSAMKDCGRHTHIHPKVTLLSLDSNNMAVALLCIGRERSFAMYQVQRGSAKEQEVKSEGGPGQMAALPFHYMDYHLLPHQGGTQCWGRRAERLIFSE